MPVRAVAFISAAGSNYGVSRSGPGDDEAGGLLGDSEVDAGEVGKSAEAVHEGVAVAKELVGLGGRSGDKLRDVQQVAADPSLVHCFEFDADDWDQTIGAVGRAAEELGDFDAVINCAGIFRAAEGASKAALVAFSKHAAVDLWRSGIRVNVVAPGWVKTSIE